jgi:pyridoxamine 5'-phosphate oxidase
MTQGKTMDPLFEMIPGFDQPIAVLKHCHDRIRKQIRTMQNLLTHLPKNGADEPARRGAEAILQYFEKAAPNHHADEEEDLFPVLRATAQGEDEAALAEVLPKIMHEHELMAQAWAALEPQLQAIAAGTGAELSAENVAAIAALYAGHMEKEEQVIAPMAKRILSAEQMDTLGKAMEARRGVGKP